LAVPGGICDSSGRGTAVEVHVCFLGAAAAAGTAYSGARAAAAFIR